MSAHTPGPWGFLNYKDDESLLSFGVSSKEEMLDRTRTGWYSLWCGIKPEDARLIAAAPELLAALKLCASVCAGETSDKNGLIRALEAARSAMKKATGAA